MASYSLSENSYHQMPGGFLEVRNDRLQTITGMENQPKRLCYRERNDQGVRIVSLVSPPPAETTGALGRGDARRHTNERR